MKYFSWYTSTHWSVQYDVHVRGVNNDMECFVIFPELFSCFCLKTLNVFSTNGTPSTALNEMSPLFNVYNSTKGTVSDQYEYHRIYILFLLRTSSVFTIKGWIIQELKSCRVMWKEVTNFPAQTCRSFHPVLTAWKGMSVDSRLCSYLKYISVKAGLWMLSSNISTKAKSK